MMSQAKINANRRNARKSTGPRTPSGKATASMNAVKHGLSARMPVIPSENEAEFQTYTAEWLEELQPASPMESFLAERIISIAWRLRRVGQMEASLFQPGESLETQQLCRLNRYEVALERSFYRNVEELRGLQAERIETADSADSTEEQNEPTGVEVPPDVLVNQPSGPQDGACYDRSLS